MAPFGHPKSKKIHPKIDPKRHPKNDRFLDRFFAQVGSMLGPKLGPKSRSRRSQNAPKTLPRRHEDSPRATRAPKIEIWSIFGPKIRWGTLLGPRISRFLARLNSNFGNQFLSDYLYISLGLMGYDSLALIFRFFFYIVPFLFSLVRSSARRAGSEATSILAAVLGHVDGTKSMLNGCHI